MSRINSYSSPVCADYTSLDLNTCGAPFWVHLVMHGIPVPLVFLVMVEKKTVVNGRYVLVIIGILAVWSYKMDAERFIGLPDFWIAYPVGG